jgi:ribokinase
VVESYPEANTKKEVLAWHEQGGGPVATALVALARLGVSCRFTGIVGCDEAGEKIERSLVHEGIDVRGLVRREGGFSQIAFIVVEENSAKRTICWKRPSGESLGDEELGNDFLNDCDFLLLDGLMEKSSLASARRAKAKNIPVMLDAGRIRPGMLEIARLSDYVVASEEFARDLQWVIEAGFLQDRRKDLGAKALTITLGEKGSMTVAEGETFAFPAFEVKAVDTTGAGDVFHGGYIFGLIRGWSLRNTVIFASALAAMKCTEVGGRAGIPRLEEAMKFLQDRGYRTF